MNYNFEWDPNKAKVNFSKHRVSFEEATSGGMIMKDEYDFSKGERGKFYNENAKFNIPVYLEPEIESFVSRAKRNYQSSCK